VLFLLEVAPALGANPVEVPVTTYSGPKTWHGFMWKASGTQLVGIADSVLTIALYGDDAVSSAVYGQLWYFSGGGGTPNVGAIASDTTPIGGLYSGVDAATISTPGGCPPVGGLAIQWIEYAQNCSSGAFQGSLSLTLPVTTGPLADFQTFTVAPQRFSGVWVK
jgi:hypothetical protein